MSQQSSTLPDVFRGYVNLAAEALGTFVLHATDEYFAEKENLLKADPPQWIDGEYTNRGKWMDGWESQRRRQPGHDSCIIRLGAPGYIHGLIVDTTHFKGNAPTDIAVEGISAPDTSTADDLIDADGWVPLLAQTPVKPDFQNIFSVRPLSRTTHVRLRIYPDGGVARFRVFGQVVPSESTFWGVGSIDLAAVENGAAIVAESDQFFGPASNLLMQGRGTHMGDGWETKRRRTPGSDWCVIRLARRGMIDRIELDTHFFKGNAPQATWLEVIDVHNLHPDDFAHRLRSPEGWTPLVSRTPLVQHRRHQLRPDRIMAATHVRVHIDPHGGVNRLRLYGHALDTTEEKHRIGVLNALKKDDARILLLSMNGSSQWADTMSDQRPIMSVRDLFRKADHSWWNLGESDFLEAFAAHPRLGQMRHALSQTETSLAWSRGEQRVALRAERSVLESMAALNDEYFEKFGFIFICYASGRSASELLETLEQRIENSRPTEIDNAAREQAKITRLRIEKWLKEISG